MGVGPIRIAILGTGVVGRTLAAAFASKGDEVVVGTRDPLAARESGSDDLGAWLEGTPRVSVATFADAAARAELVVLAVSGSHALDVVERTGDEPLEDKVLVDVTNPLDFSLGFPPTLTVCNTTSLGEQVQAAAPRARVVKTLNTVSAPVMVDPASVGGGDHDLFVCGNDAAAKDVVAALLRDRFGWTSVVDLGGITSARGTEMYLALWTRTMAAIGTANFNVRVVR